MNIFGFDFTKNKKGKTSVKADVNAPKEKEKGSIESFAPPSDIDGTIVLQSGNMSGFDVHTLDFDMIAGAGDDSLIAKSREASSQPEAELAINYIVDAAIVSDSNTPPVKLDLSRSDFGEKVKKAIGEEFSSVLSLLKFSNNGYDLFRKWYIDGKLYFPWGFYGAGWRVPVYDKYA